MTVDMSEGRDDKTVWVVVDTRDLYNVVTKGHFLRKKDAQEVAESSTDYKVRERTAYGSVESYDSQ